MIKRVMMALFVVCALCGVSPSYAETIYLKNGKKVEGKIIDKKTNYIKVMIKGIPFTYFIDEIEKIGDETAGMSSEDIIKQPLRSLGGISEEKKQLIRQLIEANGALNSINSIFADILSKVPPDQLAYYQSILQVDDIIARIIPVYDKYYTQTEIMELVSFYNSPLGKKIIELTPALMNDTMLTTAKYFEEKVAILQKK